MSDLEPLRLPGSLGHHAWTAAGSSRDANWNLTGRNEPCEIADEKGGILNRSDEARGHTHVPREIFRRVGVEACILAGNSKSSIASLDFNPSTLRGGDRVVTSFSFAHPSTSCITLRTCR